MTGQPDNSHQLLVVLDPDFGERLRDDWINQPIWIVASPANDPVMRALWASTPVSSHLTGISALTHYGDRGPEGRFLAYLDTIELHHGAMSTSTPYTVMNVVGLSLAPEVQRALEALGFKTFSENFEGFCAIRTAAEAALIRD